MSGPERERDPAPSPASAEDRPRAMILAAGRGERLRPLTERTPKPLLQAGGHPLIAYGLALLRAEGFTSVVINVHHLAGAFEEALGDGSRYGVRIHYSRESELLDSGGGIRHAAPLLADGPIVVMNGDVISAVPLRHLVKTHRDLGASATLVLRPDPRAAAYGLLGIDAAGRIRRFRGQGAPPETVRELMFASVQVLEKSLIERMPAGRAFSTTREFFPGMVQRDEPIFGWVHDGFWLTADTVSDLAEVDGRLRRDPVPPHVRRLRELFSASPRSRP